MMFPTHGSYDENSLNEKQYHENPQMNAKIPPVQK